MRWASKAPKFIALGANAFSIESFLDGVMLLGSYMELQINCGVWFFRSTGERREMRTEVLKILVVSSSVMTMLNPRCDHSIIYPQKKYVDSGGWS